MTNKNAKTKAISYMRYSSGKQGRGTSIKRQKSFTDLFVQNHNLELDKKSVYKERGRPAFQGMHRNPGTVLNNILERVALPAGHKDKIEEGTVLIIEAVDRLTRERIEKSVPLFIDLITAGIRIGVVKTNKIYDIDSLQTGINEIVNSLQIANMESQFKSDMSTKNWELKREAFEETGKKLTGKCPGWMKLNKRTNQFELIDDRVKIVKLIFEWCTAGVSRTRIAARLNDRGEKTWWKKKDWTDSTIAVILSNEAVFGNFYPGKTMMGTAVNDKNKIVRKHVKSKIAIENYFPAIMTEDEFRQANEALVKRWSGGSSGPKAKKFANLLTRVATCAVCGGPMHFKGSHTKNFKRDYLRCYNAEFRARQTPTGIAPCPNTKLHPYPELEQAALDGLTRDYILRAVGRNKTMIQELEEKKASIDSKIKATNETLKSEMANLKALTGLTYAELDPDDPRGDDVGKANKNLSLLLQSKKETAVELRGAKSKINELEEIENVEFTQYFNSISDMEEEEAYTARAQLNTYFKQVYETFAVQEDGNPIIVYQEDIPHEAAMEVIEEKAKDNLSEEMTFSSVEELIKAVREHGKNAFLFGTYAEVKNRDDMINLMTIMKVVYPDGPHLLPDLEDLKQAICVFTPEQIQLDFSEEFLKAKKEMDLFEF